MGEREIVQALPALRSNEEAPSKRVTWRFLSQANRRICNPQISPNSRCTRSQAAPEWKVQELLVLLSVMASVDDHWLKALSSYQRWKMISDNCMAMDVVRSSNQCKRKWEMLFADYKKIRKWESQAKKDSYWLLKEHKRKQLGLPISFQKEIFDAMYAVIPVQQDHPCLKSSKPDPLAALAAVSEIESPNLDANLGSKEKGLITRPKSSQKKSPKSSQKKSPKSSQKKNLLIGSSLPSEEGEELMISNKSPEEAHVAETAKAEGPDGSRVMVSRLHESAAQVCAVLGGMGSPNGASWGRASHAELINPTLAETELARKQADELVRALSGLSGVLNEFCELVKN